MKNKYYLGLDIGSISINTVLMDEQRNIIENRYDFCQGKPFLLIKGFISSEIHAKYAENSIQTIAFTGTGGKGSRGINWWSFCE